jgi:hypothetical protein
MIYHLFDNTYYSFDTEMPRYDPDLRIRNKTLHTW